LNASYPLSRLKKTNLEITGPEHYEVEKILDHKTRGGQIFYFVKWKDYPIQFATWEPESHITTVDLITDYWSSENEENAEDSVASAAGTCYIGNTFVHHTRV
jgi:Chromo (CHRromatin Organisation MOdifier) domain